MEFIIIWVLFGVASGIVSANRGNDGCAGFVLGVVLGPIGLIITLVMKPNDKALEEKALQDGDRRKCPACAELIKSEANKCRFCGTEVTPEAT